MVADLARRLSNYYLLIGGAGLAGELVLVEYVLRSGVWGEDTGNLVLAEAAFVAINYGMIFGVATLIRTERAAAEVNSLRGASSRRAVLLVLVGLIAVGGLSLSLSSIGRRGLLDTAISLLHYVPLFGIFGGAALFLGHRRRPTLT